MHTIISMTRIGLFVALGLLSGSKIAQAYDLGPPLCGGEYGRLAIEFSDNLESFDAVTAILDSFSYADSKYDVWSWVFYKPEQSTTTIRRELQRVWASRKEEDSERGDFEVPIGSEKFIAQQLVDLGIAKKITHAVGACGSLESVYALIDRRKVGDLREATEFEVFAVKSAEAFLAQGDTATDLEEGMLHTSPYPPKYSKKRLTLIAPAELTRGKRYKNKWDKFDLIIALQYRLKNEFAIVGHIENLRVSSMKNRQKIPTSDYFKPIDEYERYVAEFLIASNIMKYLSGSEKRCKIDGEAISEFDFGPFKCTGTFEFR